MAPRKIEKDNIFLIGFRCSGKTVVGRRLSVETGRTFVDTDRLIVRTVGMAIEALIRHRGWKVFRELEAAVVRDCCRRSGQVVATGGGAVLDPKNVRRMRDAGCLIWLKAGVETIGRRMAGDPGSPDFRPPLTDRPPADEIPELLSSRVPLYRQAMDFWVDTDHQTVADVCRDIQRRYAHLAPGAGPRQPLPASP